MKHYAVGFLMVVFCFTLNIWGQEKSEVNTGAMESFMDMKWGTDAKTFTENFMLKDRISLTGKSYYITSYQLTDTAAFGFTTFRFENPKDAVTRKIKKKEMTGWFFVGVVITIDSDDFEEILSIFKKKYGDPTGYAESELKHSLGAVFTQKAAVWKAPSIKRQIYLTKYNDSITEGGIYFIPITESKEEDKEKKDDTSKF